MKAHIIQQNMVIKKGLTGFLGKSKQEGVILIARYELNPQEHEALISKDYLLNKPAFDLPFRLPDLKKSKPSPTIGQMTDRKGHALGFFETPSGVAAAEKKVNEGLDKLKAMLEKD